MLGASIDWDDLKYFLAVARAGRDTRRVKLFILRGGAR